MNEKYQHHWALACELGVASKALKKAFRNLSKLEKQAKRKGYRNPRAIFISEEDGFEMFDIFFKLKGSNHGERQDAVMNYAMAAGNDYGYIEEEYAE